MREWGGGGGGGERRGGIYRGRLRATKRERESVRVAKTLKGISAIHKKNNNPKGSKKHGKSLTNRHNSNIKNVKSPNDKRYTVQCHCSIALPRQQ